MILLSVDTFALFKRLLGIRPEDARNIERTHLAFATGWPFATALLLLLCSAGWFLFNYWRDGTKPSWWVKGPLVVLRLIAVSSLMWMLAQPVLRLSHADHVKPKDN